MKHTTTDYHLSSKPQNKFHDNNRKLRSMLRNEVFSYIGNQLAKEKSKYILLITVFFCNFAAK